MIDVKTVRHLRRQLHYDNWAAVLAECRALEWTAATHGQFQARLEEWPPQRQGVGYLGNLDVGQTFEHLARWVKASLLGGRFKPPPAPLRFIARLMRHRMMNNPLPLGFKLPPDAAALYIPEAGTDATAALAHYEAAVAQLGTTQQRAPSLIFGALAPAEWDKFHFRHAELHLGYLHSFE